MVSLSFVRDTARYHIERKSAPFLVRLPVIITPNMLSLGNLFFSILAGITFAMNNFLLALLLLLIALFCDSIDGMIFRSRNKSFSGFGYFLDSGVDRIGEVVWLFGLFLSGVFPIEAVFILTTCSLLINYFRVQNARVFGDNKPGFMEKGERSMYFVILTVSLVIGVDTQILTVSFWLVSIISLLTVIQIFVRGLLLAKNVNRHIDPLVLAQHASDYPLHGT